LDETEVVWGGIPSMYSEKYVKDGLRRRGFEGMSLGTILEYYKVYNNGFSTPKI